MLSIIACLTGAVFLGPDGPVPPGAMLPGSHGRSVETGCSIAAEPRSICPSAGTLFLGDFAFDFDRRRFLVVDVPAGRDGLFWLDAMDGTIERYVDYAGVSQRGCAFDNINRVAYTAGWNDGLIWRLDDNLDVLGNQPLSRSIAGLAIDEPSRRLYAAATGVIDSLFEFEIDPDGLVSETGRAWIIPWERAADGHSAAGLDFDEATGMFLSVNQDAGSLEFFRIVGEDLESAGSCPLELEHPWGFGIDLATAQVHVAAQTDDACTNRVVPLLTVPSLGGWVLPDWQVRFEPAPPTSVAGFHTPYSFRVYNNKSITRERAVWLDAGDAGTVSLGRRAFDPGATRIFGSGPTPFSGGTYPVILGVGRPSLGDPAAVDTAWVTVTNPGIEAPDPPAATSASGLALFAPVSSEGPGPRAGSGDSICVEMGPSDRIHPRPGSVYVADMAYDAEFARFVVVDVPFLSDGIFWMDANGHQVDGYTSYAGVSQRGCAFDSATRQVYTAGWNDETLWRLDDRFRVHDAQFIGEPVAGLAVDSAARLLYAATSAEIDEIVVFRLDERGRAVPTGARWPIPWGWPSDGYSTGGLDLDEASATFVIVNQDARALEYFSVADSGLTWVGACGLPAATPWGVGFDGETHALVVTDASVGGGVSTLRSVEPHESFLGGVNLPDWSLRVSDATPYFVGNGGGPMQLVVANRTGLETEKTFWLTLEEVPSMKILLAQETLVPGENRVWAGIRTYRGRDLAAGTYYGTVHVADSLGGPPVATSPFSMNVVVPGRQ